MNMIEVITAAGVAALVMLTDYRRSRRDARRIAHLKRELSEVKEARDVYRQQGIELETQIRGLQSND